MSSTRERIEKGFEAFGHLVFDHRFKFLLLLLIFVAALVSQLPNIRIDTSNESFLHEDDPILERYNKFREQFGREEMVILAIKARDLFTLPVLAKLRDLHKELESTVPYLDDINSLMNARVTKGSKDQLIVEDLFERWPKNQAEVDAIREYALSNPLYKNLILSEDGSFTTVSMRTVAFLGQNTASDDELLAGFEDAVSADKVAVERKPISDKENDELVNKVLEIVEKYKSDDFQILSAGVPVVTQKLKSSMQKDMQGFTRSALLIIIVVLAFLFRRISGVLLPLIVVVLTVLSTVSLMAATNTAIKLPTQILPSLILAVGVAASIHLLAMFYRRFHACNDKREAVAYALGHSGLAIVMTSLTTAAGLLSFASSQVSPIADLGRFAGAGVMLGLIYTLVLIPVLIAVFPIKHKGDKTETANHPLMDSFLTLLADFSVRHARWVVGVALAVTFVSLYSLLSIRFHHDPLTWMPESWEIRQATHIVDTELKGSTTLELVVDTGESNGLYDPDLLKRMDRLYTEIPRIEYNDARLEKIFSVVDIVKESNRALNENREDFYRIPDSRDLVAQELFLFENSGTDDLEDMVDSQFSMARVTMKGAWVDAATSANYIEKAQPVINDILGGVDSYITGMGTLFTRTMNAAINSTRVSYLLAAVVISIMMILLLSDIKLGLVSMIPNLMPIIIALGAMAAMNVPLDMFTMLVGSIAVGLAVDDTIHFMHNFKRYKAQGQSVFDAVHSTLHSTGRAIVVTSIVLCCGFFVFMLSDMNNVFRFGAITGSTILLALIADLMVAPALMQLMYGKEKSNKTMENAHV